MKEIWQIGDTAHVRVEPLCPQEFKLHGIPPYANSMVGWICDIDRRTDHAYKVQGTDGNIGWFTAAELVDPSEIVAQLVREMTEAHDGK